MLFNVLELINRGYLLPKAYTVDETYDILEAKMDFWGKTLDNLINRFRHGEYNLSSEINKTRKLLDNIKAMWEFINNDEDNDTYYIPQGCEAASISVLLIMSGDVNHIYKATVPYCINNKRNLWATKEVDDTMLWYKDLPNCVSEWWSSADRINNTNLRILHEYSTVVALQEISQKNMC